MAVDYTAKEYDALAEARRNGDARTYAELAIEFGLSEDDHDFDRLLFDLGASILLREEGLAKKVEESAKQRISWANRRRYFLFLQEAEDFGISFGSSSDLSKDADVKRELLQKYFPRKFESQNMGNYEESEIGKVFLGFINYAVRALGR